MLDKLFRSKLKSATELLEKAQSRIVELENENELIRNGNLQLAKSEMETIALLKNKEKEYEELNVNHKMCLERLDNVQKTNVDLHRTISDKEKECKGREEYRRIGLKKQKEMQERIDELTIDYNRHTSALEQNFELKKARDFYLMQLILLRIRNYLENTNYYYNGAIIENDGLLIIGVKSALSEEIYNIGIKVQGYTIEPEGDAIVTNKESSLAERMRTMYLNTVCEEPVSYSEE